MDELKVTLTKDVNAPIEQVFDAWLDEKTLTRFMLPMPGMPQPRVIAEGKQGGTFTVFMQVGEKEIPHKGEYLEVSRYDKLVFTWESPFSPADSTVTIHFSPINAKQTRIDLSHVKFLDEEARDNHQGGWMNILETLETVLQKTNAPQREIA